jgi:hypothetical protein
MSKPTRSVYAFACGTAAAIALAGIASLSLIRPALATPQFAKETGKSCTDCHTSASGGGALTPFGEKFKANGNKLPKDMSGG